MTYRHQSPDPRKLRSSHLMRLALVADRVTNGIPTDGFKLALRICREAGCQFDEMDGLTPFTVDQLKEWSD